MNTTSEYIEPIGFKGSKGALLKPKYLKSIVEIDNGKDTYWFAETFAPGIGDQQVKYANAALIAQSKELAKALQDVIAAYDAKDGISYDEYYNALNGAIANAKSVLQKAGLK